MKNLWKIVCYIIMMMCLFIMPCFWDEIYSSCSNLFEWWSKASLTDIAYNGKPYMKNLIQHFCSVANWLQCVDSSDWDFSIDYFDASQSLFLSILCNSVWWNAISGYQHTNSFLKKKSFLDFGIVTSATGYLESCHSYWFMNSCDYSYNLPLIFNMLMDDFFSIKQARSFWVDELQDSFSAQDFANKFSLEHFKWLSLQKWLEKWICDDGSEYYKKTCKTLKNYMTEAENLLKNTMVLDVKKLQEIEWVDCENNRSKNILYCGLIGTDSDYYFLNTVYNEYFRYNLFLSYYSFYINWSDYVDGDAKDLDKLQENYEKIYLIENQLSKSKQAITIATRNLSEMSYSFPLHIWFLMYHEDAKLFMEKVGKIYSPLRTLYDKLRNVQIKES